MQPYFFPYAGYFRLFASCDLFILYDCVQFPRRGRVHRCEVPGPSGSVEWLTLPLAHQPQDTLIRDLAFAGDARQSLDKRLARLPWLAGAHGEAAEAVRDHLHAPLGSVIDYLEQGLRLVTTLLGFPCRIVRSSQYAVAPELHGQQRILALCQAAGADHYVNSPGGRGLYDAATFAAHGIALRFLPDYSGRYHFLLPALAGEPLEALRRDVLEESC